MSNLVNNSSTTLLLANQAFRGTTIKLDQQFMTVTVSVNTDVSGTLSFYQGQDGFNFSNIGNEYAVNGVFHKEVILTGLYFYIRYTNGSVNQTRFNLFTKLSLNVRDQTASGGGSGGDVNITGCEVTLPISGSVTCDISGQTVVVSGVATEATLSDTYTLLNDNIGTGGLSVSLTALDGEKISNTVVNLKRGLDVNLINSLTVDISGQRVVTDISGQTVDISGQRVVTDISGQTVDISGQRVLVDISGQTVNVGNAVSVNVLDVNSTVYDFTNDSSTITQADSRFEVDRIRPDSWSFTNFKNQTGSNAFFYSNSAASPIGAQQFNILHGDLESLYFVAGINRTDDINAVPFMAVFSPSNIAFYTSRWVYTIDPSEKLIQGEKVLLYYGVDPVHIYTNLRHLQLMKNVIASQGPQLESETCYLMSINTASGLTASSVYYNLYNCGWILNDVKHTHNDYAFSSGIQSRADFLLSKLNITDGELLDCAVRNTVDVSSQSLSSMTFDTINTNDGNKQGLNVIVRNQFYPTTVTFTEDDISIDDMTPPIDVRAYNRLSVFGVSSHTGGGSHNIILMYSNDDITYYDSPNVIAATATKFAYDNSTFCVSYIKFRFQVQIETLTFNVSLK